jgi:hypothetical protein
MVQQNRVFESKALLQNAIQNFTKSPNAKPATTDRMYAGSSYSTKNATSNHDKATGSARNGQQWPAGSDLPQKTSGEKSQIKSSQLKSKNTSNLLLPPQLFSAQSSKIGASIFNRSGFSIKQIENSGSVQQSKRKNEDKTPNRKIGNGWVEAFNIAGSKNNTHDKGDVRIQNIESSESYKSSVGPNQSGGDISIFK